MAKKRNSKLSKKLGSLVAFCNTKKTKKKVNKVMVSKEKLTGLILPVAYRLVPLHIVETTEKYLGYRTRYLDEIKTIIFGRY